MPTDFYDVLGASADASSDELKRAYRSRVREYHPDVNDHPEGDAQFKLIRTANEVLTDPAERKDYDRLGHREYTKKHLDDVPPFSVFPEFDDAGPGASDEESERTSTSTSSTATGSPSTGGTTQSTTSTTSSQSRRRNRTQQSSSTTGSTDSDSTATDSATSSATTSSTSGTGTAGSENTSGSRATAGADTTESTEWANVSGTSTGRTTDDSTTPAGVRRRRGLRRWYGVVVVALLAYLGGLGGYVLANREAALALVADVQNAPVATLLGAVPLPSPTGYVLGAVDAVTAGTPGLALLFLAGTVLLPAVVLTAVAQFGRGSAWMYALASLGPPATLVAYPFVLLPVAALLVGVVVLPLVSGLGFLVDVGRYLLATR